MKQPFETQAFSALKHKITLFNNYIHLVKESDIENEDDTNEVPENVLQEVMGFPENQVTIREEFKKIFDHEQDVYTILGLLSLEMIALFEAASNHNLLFPMMSHMVEHINEWVIVINDWASKKAILLPALCECACTNSDNFNRLMNARRAVIENRIVDFVKQRFQSPESDKIHYLSMGCGGLLQDFIFIGKCLMAGYKHIHISLVDVIYKEGIEAFNPFQQFSQLPKIAQEIGATVSIEGFSSIAHFSQKNAQGAPHVIAVIDHDDFYTTAFNDTVTAHKLLASDGRMFLSFNLMDLEFSSQKLESESQQPNEDSLIQKLSIQPKEHVHLCNLSCNETMILVMHEMVPWVRKNPHVKEVTLTMPKPQEINFFGVSLGHKKINPHISSENLGYYIGLALPGIKIHLNWIDGYKGSKKIIQEFTSCVKQPQDLIVFTIHKKEVGDKHDAQEIMNVLHYHSKQAHIIMGLRFFDLQNNTQENQSTFYAEYFYDGLEKKCIALEGDESSKEVIRMFLENPQKENPKNQDDTIVLNLN